MNLAADYMNEKPNAKNLTVAAQYPGFEQYFKGRTVDMDNISQSNYIVFYLCLCSACGTKIYGMDTIMRHPKK